MRDSHTGQRGGMPCSCDLVALSAQPVLHADVVATTTAYMWAGDPNEVTWCVCVGGRGVTNVTMG